MDRYRKNTAIAMDVERASVNRFVVPGRELQDNYLCVFTRVEDGTVKKCITQNSGSEKGPLLLEIEEKTSPVAVDAEVELIAGDWFLEVYEQASASNLIPGGTAKHSEQIRVN